MRLLRRLIVFLPVAALMVASVPTALMSEQGARRARARAAGANASGQRTPQRRARELTTLEKCQGEQALDLAAAAGPPTYRVGAALAKGVKAEDLDDGLEVPDTRDLTSPEVTNLRKQLLEARQQRRVVVERDHQNFYKYRWYRGLPRTVVEQLLAAVPLVYKQYQDLQDTSAWQALPAFDWRERGLDVGPVLHQGKCGSCWAFAAISVYLSSWNLEQLRLGEAVLERVVPEYYNYHRVPSVQQLLNCVSKTKGDCGGGWHGSAFAFMVNSHVPHIPDRVVFEKRGVTPIIEGYTGRKLPCTDLLRNRRVRRGGQSNVTLEGPDSRPKLPGKSDHVQTAFDRALAWGYVNAEDPEAMPTVEQLKAALVEHGPLAVTINADHCFTSYKGGVFNGRKKYTPNHVLVLIGWDDDKRAWLVKNSWGEEWGEAGFGWVEYGSNNIGLYAAWIQPSPSTVQ